MNWLDWLIIGIFLLSIIGGFREGFVRMGIGMAALIVGFFAASWFHGSVSAAVQPWVHSRAAATIIGFFTIFLLIVIIGALIAAFIARVLKIVGLSFVDRLLGGAFGFVRATVVLAVGTMLLMAFAPKRLPAAVNQSELAPYIIGTSRIISAVTPYEFKQGVERTYAELENIVADLKSKKKKKD